MLSLSPSACLPADVNASLISGADGVPKKYIMAMVRAQPPQPTLTVEWVGGDGTARTHCRVRCRRRWGSSGGWCGNTAAWPS